jgi:hypothetical protein
MCVCDGERERERHRERERDRQNGVKYRIKNVSSALRMFRICAVAINICARLMILQ